MIHRVLASLAGPLFALQAPATPPQQRPSAAPPQRAVPDAAPAFVVNRGQWHGDVLHAARFGALRVFLERSAFTVDVQHVDREEGEPTGVRGAAVRFSFATPADVRPGAALPSRHTFLLGPDRSRWCTAPAHASVRYESIAPGVSLEAYSKERHFEYDVLADAGASLADVTIEVAGADALELRADGTLALALPCGPIVQSAPIAFLADGRRIACRVELRGPRAFGFVAPEWSGREPLRIDPGLTWSSYIGGSAADGIGALVVGNDGLVTIAGGSSSLDFPMTLGAYQTTPVNSDCYVARFDPSQPAASQLVSATWYGGNNTDNFASASVDAAGVVSLFGSTRSNDLPLVNAFQATFGGGTTDALVARIDLQQTGAAQLLFASYLGGAANETVQGPCTALVVANGVMTVTASTLSMNFPTTANAWSQTYAGGSGSDGFLAQIDPSQPPGSQLVYSTYFGGTAGDGGLSLDRDANGRIAVFGTTSSTNFPVTANAFDATLGGPGDAMLMLWDLTLPPAQQIVYATYFGGSLGDTAPTMRLDRTGAFCFGGHTFSSDLPVTANAFDAAFDTQDAYCARLDPSLPAANQLTYCTFVGGGTAESGTALLVDAAGVITFAGGTTSTNFPVTDGTFQTNNAGGVQDIFVVRIDPARPPAQQLLYATYLGGSGLESCFALAADGTGAVWATGFTASTNFPTTANGLDPSANGANDGFLARLDMLPTGVTAFGASTPGCSGRLAASVTSIPKVGNPNFTLTCTNVSAPSLGIAAFSPNPAVLPISVIGIDLWIDPNVLILFAMVATQPGADFVLPIPASAPTPLPVGISFSAQFVWYSDATGPSCPATGWSASNAITFVVQP